MFQKEMIPTLPSILLWPKFNFQVQYSKAVPNEPQWRGVIILWTITNDTNFCVFHANELLHVIQIVLTFLINLENVQSNLDLFTSWNIIQNATMKAYVCPNAHVYQTFALLSYSNKGSMLHTCHLVNLRLFFNKLSYSHSWQSQTHAHDNQIVLQLCKRGGTSSLSYTSPQGDVV